jgi:hypothetical protein
MIPFLLADLPCLWQDRFQGNFGTGATMLIHLHKQATTTPKLRAAIQASDEAGTASVKKSPPR